MRYLLSTMLLPILLMVSSAESPAQVIKGSNEFSFTRSGFVVRKAGEPGEPYLKNLSLNDFSYGYYLSRRWEVGASFDWGNSLRVFSRI